MIGFVDDMEGFKIQLNKLLGIRINIPHENKAVISKQQKNDLITPELRERIEILCSNDIELYNFAKELK